MALQYITYQQDARVLHILRHSETRLRHTTHVKRVAAGVLSDVLPRYLCSESLSQRGVVLRDKALRCVFQAGGFYSRALCTGAEAEGGEAVAEEQRTSGLE